jgi:hypothetical protein
MYVRRLSASFAAQLGVLVTTVARFVLVASEERHAAAGLIGHSICSPDGISQVGRWWPQRVSLAVDDNGPLAAVRLLS